jgi:hypothetical protein
LLLSLTAPTVAEAESAPEPILVQRLVQRLDGIRVDALSADVVERA